MSVGIVELVPGEPVRGSIRPPGSKSLTNRALLCAAFAKGPSTLLGALNSEDTTVMVDSLRKIGVNVETQDGGRTLRVDGSLTSRETSPTELFIGNSGTTVRFLTAALSALGGNYRLSGVPRMHQRPIGDLVDAIAGVIEGSIETESSEACPPVRIDSHGWNGNEIRVAGSISSQYLSGLMMAAPIALQTTNRSSEASKIINIHVLGELVSRPYVEMTGSVMKSFGANVSVNDRRDANDQESVTVQIQSSGYQGLSYDIEPDASAASYFWAAAAITGGQVTVEGLTPDAMQGDVGFCEVLEQMGCKRVIENHGITIIGGELK
ncbi:MAG: 3-phosphoshikimate 1-carboxyvinyltransferase, partial [Planctomycetota bacterium]